MMHRFMVMFIIAAAALMFSSCDSKDGGSEVSYTVYVGGICYSDRSTQVPGYWKNGTWTGLQNGVDSTNSKGAMVMSITADSAGNVTVGGFCRNSSDVAIAGCWDNSVWTSFPNGADATNAYGTDFTAMAVDSAGIIYVAGECNKSGSSERGYWKKDGSTVAWIKLSDTANVSAIAVDDSDNLYVGGSASGVPGYWLNGTWTALANGEDSSNTNGANVRSIVVVSGVVYASGYCCNSSDVSIPGYWEDGTWNGLVAGDGSVSVSGSVANLIKVSSDGAFYIFGYYIVGSTTAYGYWHDGTWRSFDFLGYWKLPSGMTVDPSGNVYISGFTPSEKSGYAAFYFKNGVLHYLTNPYDSNLISYAMPVTVVE